MSRFEQDKEQEARAARQAVQTEAFKVWLSQKHPEVKLTTALFNEVLDYMQDSFLTAGPEDFEYSIQNIGTSYMRQHVPTEDEIKAELIDKIMGLLESTNNKHWQVPHNVKTERTKMAFWSTEQLTARLEEITRAQTLAKQTPAELRSVVQSAREPVSMWPRLPQRLVPRGTVTSVAVDADFLNNLAKNDINEFIRICKLFGTAQVDERRGIR